MTFIQPKRAALVLAPMEGVTDAALRSFLTRTGHYDYCVSEFIRVSGHPIPAKVFLKEVPELRTGAATSSHVPVQVQILGGHPERMAESALHAVSVGAKAIDLNFGCPAPTVNRNDGGATLLLYPDRIESIIRTIRDALPAHIPLSAKMRLGFEDPTAIYENSRRAEQGGAAWITIHGRTKKNGYAPPAYWKPIGEVVRALSIPVIANGEIFSLSDFRRCREETGAIHFMIGRAALAVPHLAGQIRKELGLEVIVTPAPLKFPENTLPQNWIKIFRDFMEVDPSEKKLKQWIRYLRSKNEVPWWDEVKVLGSATEILSRLEQLQEATPSA